MPHAESSDQRGDRHVAVADVQKQGQELEELAGLSRFGLGLLAPCALRYASLPLLACPKFGRAWNSEDSEDSEQFQTSTCYQSLEAKHARILNVFFA